MIVCTGCKIGAFDIASALGRNHGGLASNRAGGERGVFGGRARARMCEPTPNLTLAFTASGRSASQWRFGARRLRFADPSQEEICAAHCVDDCGDAVVLLITSTEVMPTYHVAQPVSEHRLPV